jgi:hypothetical protein
MKKMITLVFVAGAFLGACKKDDSCAQVSKQICEAGKLDCGKTRTWLEAQMTGPDDKPLDGEQREAACKMLLGDKEALAGYREQAVRDLGAAK